MDEEQRQAIIKMAEANINNMKMTQAFFYDYVSVISSLTGVSKKEIIERVLSRYSESSETTNQPNMWIVPPDDEKPT